MPVGCYRNQNIFLFRWYTVSGVVQKAITDLRIVCSTVYQVMSIETELSDEVK